MTRKRIKYPQALAIAKRRDANLWMLGDQLLADMGKPPKFFTTCQQRIEDAFPDQEDDAKLMAQVWRAADAFQADTRMQVGIEAHIAAGGPAVLQAALTTWQRDSMMKHVKLVKQGLAMTADEEGFFRKRRSKREREPAP
jgi:hypothetical protein